LTIDIRGGVVGEEFNIVFGTANISGGTIGDSFTAGTGSEVNISGGSFITIDDRNVILSGTFLDGSSFAFNLGSTLGSSNFFDNAATLTITTAVAVPEPNGSFCKPRDSNSNCVTTKVELARGIR